MELQRILALEGLVNTAAPRGVGFEMERDAALPLTMPPELWEGLAEKKRIIFRRAQAVLDCLSDEGELGLEQTCDRVGASLQDLVPALRLLVAIGLIGVGRGGVVTLRALPGQHVETTGPDGRTRWLFIMCPVRAATADPAKLN